jgi:hypothetical protein
MKKKMKILKNLILIFIMVSTLVSETQATAPPVVFVWINTLQEIEVIVDTTAAVNENAFTVLDSSSKLYTFVIARKTTDSVILRLNEKNLADCQSAGLRPIESTYVKLLDGVVEIQA